MMILFKGYLINEFPMSEFIYFLVSLGFIAQILLRVNLGPIALLVWIFSCLLLLKDYLVRYPLGGNNFLYILITVLLFHAGNSFL